MSCPIYAQIPLSFSLSVNETFAPHSAASRWTAYCFANTNASYMSWIPLHSPLSSSMPVRTHVRVGVRWRHNQIFSPILLRRGAPLRAPAINRPFVITIAIMTASWTISLISNTEKTHLYSLRSVNMNESDLRVNSLPYITTVWVNYLLTLKNTRQILKPRYLKIWMLEPKEQHQHQSTTALIYML